MTKVLFDEGLIVEFESTLGGVIDVENLYYEQDMPEVVTDLSVMFRPVFTEINPQISERGIVFDLYKLWQSTQRPGAYYFLTCTCGDAEHASIYSPVYVSFPDEKTVVWELCGKGLKLAIEEIWRKEGFVRLIFKREKYEASVVAMIQQLKNLIAPPFTVDDIEIKPDSCRGLATDFFSELDLNAEIVRAPVFEPNTLIEIGAFDDRTHKINLQKSNHWLGHYFSHWKIEQAFDEWLAFYHRGHVFDPTSMFYRYQDYILSGEVEIEKITSKPQSNHLYLVSAASRDVVHAAGERFAKLLQLAINEVGYGENIQVVYRPVERPAVYR